MGASAVVRPRFVVGGGRGTGPTVGLGSIKHAGGYKRAFTARRSEGYNIGRAHKESCTAGRSRGQSRGGGYGVRAQLVC